jgi:hypothetical protein
LSQVDGKTTGRGAELIMIDMETLLDRGIAAVVPKYQQGSGNVVEIITSDGLAASYPHTVQWALRHIAQYYGIDLEAIKAHYAKMLNIKHNLPIPMAVDAIFMPVKVRKPVVDGDTASGFVNILQINDVCQDDEGVYIKFRSGQRLRVLQSVNTVRNHLRDATVVRQDFLRRYIERREKSSIFHEMEEQYNMPATKGDIAVIADRLMALMNRLGQ